MADRKRSKALKPLTWREASGHHLARRVVNAVSYRDSTDCYRIQELIGYIDQPFVAMVHDLIRGGRSHWYPIGRHATLANAKSACEQHRQAPETNGTAQFTEGGDPLPRKFWE